MCSHVSKASELSLVKGLIIYSKKLNYARAHARKMIVRTYWRDNQNPFPGRMTEQRIEVVPINKQVRTLTQILANPQDQDERNLARMATMFELEKHYHNLDVASDRFEEIADQALEKEYQ